MHQGADGIHVKYENESDTLSLYWGESKMEKSINSALKNCFKSLKGFLLDTYGHDSPQARDISLITSNLLDNTNNVKLENILVRYFDLDDPLSNKLEYKGICFVGFNSDSYPTSPFEKTVEDLKDEFIPQMKVWLDNGGRKIKDHVNLEKFEIHIFFMPFPSVQEFRDQFLKLVQV